MMCSRCGAGPAGYELFDRCALCGTKLCDDCMAAGCCGQVPAVSGREQEREAALSGRNGDAEVRIAPAARRLAHCCIQFVFIFKKRFLALQKVAQQGCRGSARRGG